MYRKFLKRVIDFTLAFIVLVFLIPALLVIALLIRIDSKGPIFFNQERLGKEGKVFLIYKFRTMMDGAEKKGSGLRTAKGDPRITRIGNILRKTSIDELPQLINIVKGEMSLIGPRPAPVVLLNRMTDEEKGRFKRRPGITGWAQVNGRTSLTWEEKFKLDRWYCNNQSFLLDFKILIKTLVVVCSSKDVYTDRYAEEVKNKNK